MIHTDCFLIVPERPDTTGGCNHSIWPLHFFVLALLVLPAHADKLRLEIAPEWNGLPLVIGKQLGNHLDQLAISRVDGLVSDLALQRTNGTWLESDLWTAVISFEKGRLSALADGLPAEEFKAIRFRVGVDAKTDASDPQQWPPDHPLHPDVCGLHWGWNSGYVFLAIEGRWAPAPGKISGFSYHLAGAVKPMIVELPASFSGERPTTIRMSMDIAHILSSGKVIGESSSTHSREGDTQAPVLKERVSGSFRVKSIETDLYQEKAPTLDRRRSTDPGHNATPYRLNISERLPKAKLPLDNPLTVEGVELGRRLFHETRLSKGNVQSCATCHDAARAFTDGQPYSTGASGAHGRRNTMPLMNLAWAKEFFWDGRAKSLREQVLMPIQDAHEMNEKLETAIAKLLLDEAYQNQFRVAFGDDEITPERLGLALEQFLLTLVSQESKFDRAARKLAQLTSQEQRGLQLFVTEHDPARGLRGADCFHCHGGNLFTNHQFMNNGLEERVGDAGRMEATGFENDRSKFKVPTLRNVALTAPYMHDGRFATLEEVVEHYNSKLHRTRTLDPNLAKHPESGLGLSAEDKAALVAFLKTLTEEQFLRPHQLSKIP